MVIQRVLRRRHLTSDTDVQRVVQQIETLVPRDHLEKISEQAIQSIQKTIKGHRTAFAWSGGKDSLVLEHLMRRADVSLEGMLGITAGLEYPAMDQWYRQHVPEGVHILELPVDLPWLAKHADTLFCLYPPHAGYWADHVWIFQQNRFCAKHQKDMLILGRRKRDDNYCGPKEAEGLYPSQGVLRYLPIMNWEQEEILAYLHYYHIALPPVYSWFMGFKCGGHPWPARASALDEEDGWAQTYACDPSIVEQAAAYLPGARAYLDHPTPIKSLHMHVWGGRILEQ